jgi:hypothetical protein
LARVFPLHLNNLGFSVAHFVCIANEHPLSPPCMHFLKMK